MKSLTCFLAFCVLLTLPAAVFAGNTSPAGAPAGRPLTWIEMSPMPTPRYTTSVAVSPQETIFVIGGDNYTCTPLATVEEYDPRTNTWRERAPMMAGRWSFGAATGVDGKIYAIGGLGGPSCGADVLELVEAYDPATNTWTPRASLPTPRWALGVAAATNGKIYAIGGQDRSGPLLVVEEYDPLTDTWTRKADMPIINQSFGLVAASNGKIYMMGGTGLNNRTWEYDPVADTWTAKAPMPTGRDTLGVAQARTGLIYAIGGFVPGSRSAIVEEYDPATDQWATQTSLSAVRTGMAAAAVRNVVYVMGGWSTRPDGSEGPVGRVEAAKSSPR